MTRIKILSISFFLIILGGCSPDNQQSQNQNFDYETTKKMVLDLLKSEEGAQTITDVIANEQTQETYVIHDDTVKTAVTENLTSDKGKEFWSKMFSDHEFVKKFTEAMVDQQEDIFKRLMADSSYQEQMLELFSNPEYAQLIQSQLKSQQFKGHLEESIQETLESPLFKATVSEIIIQHAKKIVSEDSGEGEQESTGSQSKDESGSQSE